MIRRLAKILALSLLACYIYLPGECEKPSPFPFSGGLAHPFAWNPQYDVSEPQSRQQSTVDEQIYGSSVAPAGGAGLMWTWRF
jgi:hypothetical protein